MSRSDRDEITVCDGCFCDVHCDDVTIPNFGPMKNKELCPDCWEEYQDEMEDDYNAMSIDTWSH